MRPAVRAQGAGVVIADGLDAEAVRRRGEHGRARDRRSPDDGAEGGIDFKKFDDSFAVTNRLRTEGTDNLLAAAQATGVRRFVFQSYAGWNLQHGGSATKTERIRSIPTRPPRGQDDGGHAHLESRVTNAEGIEGVVLRYAELLRPDRRHRQRRLARRDDPQAQPPVDRQRRRHLVVHPLRRRCGRHGEGDRGHATGIYQVADDDPAPASVWLPEFARILGAKPPRHVPAWLGRLAVGDLGVTAFTEIRGADNTLAKKTFDWQPNYASWRAGFREGL